MNLKHGIHTIKNYIFLTIIHIFVKMEETSTENIAEAGLKKES